MNFQPFSVPKIWIPTVFSELGASPLGTTNLAGCENCCGSPLALAALKNIDPRLLVEHWDAQDKGLRLKLAQLHGVEPKQVFLTSGAIAGIHYSFEVFSRANTAVGLLMPDFPGFRYFAEHAGTALHWLKHEEFPFEHSLDSIVTFSEQRDLGFLILSNPSAVTGTCKSVGDIERLVTAVPNTFFVIDEADAIDTDSAARLTRTNKNMLVLRSFSKFYGLSGLRIGYMVVPPQCVSHFDRTINPVEVTSLSIVAASAALDDVEFQSQTQSRVGESLQILEKALTDTPYQIVPGSRCFAAYVCSAEPAEDPCDLLKRHEIDIVPGPNFGLRRGGRLNLSDPTKVRLAAEVLSKS